MIRIILTLILAMAPAAADDASKSALIEEMLTLTGAERMFDATLKQQSSVMVDQMKRSMAQNPQMAPLLKDLEPLLADFERSLLAVMQRAMAWSKLKPQLTAIYNDLFTEEELAAIVAFNKTPAGQALILKNPELMKRSMEMGQRQMQGATPELQKLIEELRVKATALGTNR